MVAPPTTSSQSEIRAEKPPPEPPLSGGKSFTSKSSSITPPKGRARNWSVTSTLIFLKVLLAYKTFSTRICSLTEASTLAWLYGLHPGMPKLTSLIPMMSRSSSIYTSVGTLTVSGLATLVRKFTPSATPVITGSAG